MDDDATRPATPDPSEIHEALAVGAAATRAAQQERVVRLVEEVALTEARIAALHAHQVSVLSDLQGDPHVAATGLDVADELAPRLRWTAFTTDRRLATAARVATCFPVLFEDLRGGEVDYHRIDVVVREADLLDEDQARVLDAVLSGRLAGLTTAQIKHLARREIAVIDSEAVKERARRVVAERRVAYTALPDGQGLLEVLGPAPAVRAAYDHLDALARDTARPGATTDPYGGYPGTGSDSGTTSAVSAGSPSVATTDGAAHRSAPDGSADPAPSARGIDARRFDACVEAMTAPPDTRPGVTPGTGPQITIAWPAAVGLDDLPAHLSGHGAVPAELVRHLLRHTGFRKVATHPTTGHVTATATDGHLHPAGVLPDVVRDPPAAGGSDDEAAAGPDRALTTGTSGTTTSASRSAPGDTSGATGAPAPREVPAPAGRRGRRRVHTGPLQVPDEIALAEPGPGWSDELGGFDDGCDLETITGPDATDLDAYVTRVLVDVDDRPPEGISTDDDATHPAQRAARRPRHPQDGDPAPVDPAPGPRADEFEVTLAITGTRPATIVNPHRVHDRAAWTRRAERRARTALASCPAAADPAHPYRFGAALRRYLVLRSPTCAAPGCRAPAHRCDLDHTTAHAAGGPTCACNAGPLCRRHHTAKHTGWTVTRTHDDPDDPSLTWLSPLGYLYTVPPTPLFPPVPAVVAAHLAERRTAALALERDVTRRPTGPGVDATRRHAVDHRWDRDCRACDPVRPPVLPRPQQAPVDGERPGDVGAARWSREPADPGRRSPGAPELPSRPPAGPDDDPPF